MRIAEIVTAVLLGLLSIGLMIKSAELPIGWLEGEGPGGGAFPFWLAAGMLVCCVWIIVRWFRGTSPPSQSDEPFMDREALAVFCTGAGSLIVTVYLISWIGVYGAIPLMLIFYMRFVGDHSWSSTALLAVIFPVAIFFFFEIALTIQLPKGIEAIEAWYYPLYDWFL